MQKLKVGGLILAIGVFILFAGFYPTGKKAEKPKDITPLQNDQIALSFCPTIIPHEQYGSPEVILYRLARDKEGNYYLACHPVYPHEKNPHQTFWAFINRVVYTGGLSLQKWIFGPMDIELFVINLNKNLKVEKIEYEDADFKKAEEKIFPGLFKDFLVIHQKKILSDNEITLCFAISSWNHMHTPKPKEACQNIPKTPVKYFSENLWQEYGMTKNPPTLFKKNRAFRTFELLE